MGHQTTALSRLDRGDIIERYRSVRGTTLRLCDPLSPEDMMVQVELCASPTKWHLAHTTWFFETFVLKQFEPGFARYNEAFAVLFNSYYHQAGERHPRGRRGLLTRPGLGEVMAFRDVVDDRVANLIRSCNNETLAQIAVLIELGLNHEQQHQELLLTDVKLLLDANPLRPAYSEADVPAPARPARPLGWVEHAGGVVRIGHEGDGFAYDNETPSHRVFLEPFALADRPITAGEFAAFVADSGYKRSELWLDEGWTWLQSRERRPRYWSRSDGDRWTEFTMFGQRPLDAHAPMCHLSFFEADAYARWAGARLPTEAEWEHAAADVDIEGNFLERGRLHPDSDDASGLRQMFGDVWEWTRSAHEPYPGYAPPPGAIGEYNGKFMCGQFIARGGSCLTSRSHIRPTYRNFFEPGAQWQYTGVRLARSIA
ncbi:MAG: ergothioneine biosynthesis protein EgtB [Phycisphaerales bacterium]